MIEIRQYHKKDKENLVKICYETSSLPIETEKQRKFLTLMFNDYYTEVEPENCFVAVDEQDEAVGYIICSEDFDNYYKYFKNFFLPEIKELSFSYYLSAKGEIFLHSLFKKEYPAHLHIDILDTCQGQGVGTRLVKTLCEHLEKKKVKGLMLSCGMSNKAALKFYKKNNFKQLKNILGSCILAKKL